MLIKIVLRLWSLKTNGCKNEWLASIDLCLRQLSKIHIIHDNSMTLQKKLKER